MAKKKKKHCEDFRQARTPQRRGEKESIENGTSQVEAVYEVPRQSLSEQSGLKELR